MTTYSYPHTRNTTLYASPAKATTPYSYEYKTGDPFLLIDLIHFLLIDATHKLLICHRGHRITPYVYETKH